MEVGVCGYGFSGSGAVLDLLKEYSGVLVADKTELSFIYKPDGINDLYNSICVFPSRYFSSDSAIRRFIQYMERNREKYNRLTKGEFDQILQRFINSIIEVRWKGSTSVHYYQDKGLSFFFKQKSSRALRKRVEKIFGPIKIHCYPEIEMYYSSISDSRFHQVAKEFVSEMISAMQGDCKADIIAIDQAFSANDPYACFPYFSDPKAIVVLRDPRDIYLLAKCSLGLSGSFIPSDSVDDFIVYYRGLLNSSKYTKNDPNVLTINFEELVYSLDNARGKIEHFLGLKNNTTNSQVFKPEISINNTQLWLKYPQYMCDIEIIENQMSDYLFQFDSYSKKPSFDHNTF